MRSSFLKTGIAVALSSIVVILLHYSGFLRPVERAIYAVTNPLITSSTRLVRNAADITQYFSKRNTLIWRIKELEENLLRAQVQSATLARLQTENDALRSLTGLNADTTEGTVAAIIGKTIDNTANTILINRGTHNGIHAGNAVLAADGILLGTVARVTENTAIVRLINDPHSKIAAAKQGEPQSIGIVESGFGTSLALTTVLPEQTLEPGLRIVTSGLEDSLPYGLIIGSVVAVNHQDFEPFQQAILEPAIDARSVLFVRVLVENPL